MKKHTDAEAWKWLENAVLYNIYPQSFYDTNGDGIGDLPGIIQKLDYIERLGVDVLWLNPIYASPFGDAGYDVTDHYKVAPRYGRMSDLKALIRECHKRGLRLVLDLVPGHTSNEHPWFKQSCSPEKNPYSDWYIWNEEGFGHCQEGMVNGYGQKGHYLPNFFWFQPALNYGYENPKQPWQLPVTHPAVRAVHAELEKLMRHWLDIGVDGFRVDMAASLVKEDPKNTGNKRLWRKIRGWMDREYPGRVLISEWSLPIHAIDSGYHADFMIHFNNNAYNSLFRLESGRNIFPSHGHSFFDRKGMGDITEFLDLYEPYLKLTRRKGLISVPTGNHDLPRINQGRSVAELKVAYAFLMTLPGLPAIYYGDEIGMRNIPEVKRKEGGFIRCAARTPMQWNRGLNMGFSTAKAAELYLPVDSRKHAPNVADQEGKKESLLEFTRQLIELRKQNPALGGAGNFQTLHARKKLYPLAYLRQKGRQKILVIANPSGREQRASFRLPKHCRSARVLLGKSVSFTVEKGVGHCTCGATSYLIAELGG